MVLLRRENSKLLKYVSNIFDSLNKMCLKHGVSSTFWISYMSLHSRSTIYLTLKAESRCRTGLSVRDKIETCLSSPYYLVFVCGISFRIN